MLISGVEPWGEGVFWLMLVVGVTCACATSIWLAAVYRTYETTVALPIEYGALNVCSVMAGLLFYDESHYMSRWQLGLVLGGAAVVLMGIAMSLRSTLKAVGMTRRGSIHLDTPRDGVHSLREDSGGAVAISPADVRTAGAIPGIGGSDREAHAYTTHAADAAHAAPAAPAAPAAHAAHAAHAAAAHGPPAARGGAGGSPAISGGAASQAAASQAAVQAPSSSSSLATAPPPSTTAPSPQPGGAARGGPLRSSCEC